MGMYSIDNNNCLRIRRYQFPEYAGSNLANQSDERAYIYAAVSVRIRVWILQWKLVDNTDRTAILCRTSHCISLHIQIREEDRDNNLFIAAIHIARVCVE